MVATGSSVHDPDHYSAMAASGRMMDARVATVASRFELEALLRDDVPYGDLATDALGIGDVPGVMRFAARNPMVLALAEDAAALIELAGARVELLAASGSVLEKGAAILR